MVVELWPHQVCLFSPVLSSEMQAKSPSYRLCIFTPVFHCHLNRKPSKFRALWFLTLQPVFPSGFFFSSEKVLLSYRTWALLVGGESSPGKAGVTAQVLRLCCDSGSEAPSELQGNRRAWWLRRGLSSQTPWLKLQIHHLQVVTSGELLCISSLSGQRRCVLSAGEVLA